VGRHDELRDVTWVRSFCGDAQWQLLPIETVLQSRRYDFAAPPLRVGEPAFARFRLRLERV
jgi:hypothetical protein